MGMGMALASTSYHGLQQDWTLALEFRVQGDDHIGFLLWLLLTPSGVNGQLGIALASISCHQLQLGYLSDSRLSLIGNSISS